MIFFEKSMQIFLILGTLYQKWDNKPTFVKKLWLIESTEYRGSFMQKKLTDKYTEKTINEVYREVYFRLYMLSRMGAHARNDKFTKNISLVEYFDARHIPMCELVSIKNDNIENEFKEEFFDMNGNPIDPDYARKHLKRLQTETPGQEKKFLQEKKNLQDKVEQKNSNITKLTREDISKIYNNKDGKLYKLPPLHLPKEVSSIFCHEEGSKFSRVALIDLMDQMRNRGLEVDEKTYEFYVKLVEEDKKFDTIEKIMANKLEYCISQNDIKDPQIIGHYRYVGFVVHKLEMNNKYYDIINRSMKKILLRKSLPYYVMVNKLPLYNKTLITFLSVSFDKRKWYKERLLLQKKVAKAYTLFSDAVYGMPRSQIIKFDILAGALVRIT